MKRFVKENLTLTVGISLPIVLVLIFALGAILPKKLVSNAQFDVLYLTMPYPHDGVLPSVADGKLKIAITPAVRKGKLPMPRLFRFNAKTQTSTELPLTLSAVPKNIPNSKNELLDIPEMADVKIDPSAAAPDGYKAEFSSPDSSNLIFFVSNSYKRSLIIQKNDNVINIVNETNNAHSDKSIKFIGWIIPK